MYFVLLHCKFYVYFTVADQLCQQALEQNQLRGDRPRLSGLLLCIYTQNIYIHSYVCM